MYGEGTLFAIEYVPFFLYYLIAAKKNARLGGLSNLGTAKMSKDLLNEGLDKFYVAITSVIRS